MNQAAEKGLPWTAPSRSRLGNTLQNLCNDLSRAREQAVSGLFQQAHECLLHSVE